MFPDSHAEELWHEGVPVPSLFSMMLAVFSLCYGSMFVNEQFKLIINKNTKYLKFWHWTSMLDTNTKAGSV